MCGQTEHVQAEASDKSTLQFISKASLDLSNPALLWSSCKFSQRDTEKAFIKARFLTGTYKLQAHEAKYGAKKNQHSVDPCCLLCNSEPETIRHCLMVCPVYEEVRRHYLCKLVQTLRELTPLDNFEFDYDICLQITLDCQHESLPVSISSNADLCNNIECISRDFIYQIHTRMGHMLVSASPPQFKKPKRTGSCTPIT